MVSYQVEIATILDILQKNINAMIDIYLFHSHLVWISTGDVIIAGVGTVSYRIQIGHLLGYAVFGKVSYFSLQ